MQVRNLSALKDLYHEGGRDDLSYRGATEKMDASPSPSLLLSPTHLTSVAIFPSIAVTVATAATSPAKETPPSLTFFRLSRELWTGVKSHL